MHLILLFYPHQTYPKDGTLQMMMTDGLNYTDSVFGEIESNISFGEDGGESDAPLDHHTRMHRDIVIQPDNENYKNTDTDIRSH